MFNYIINPKNNKKISIKSKQGINILRNYLKKLGGASTNTVCKINTKTNKCSTKGTINAHLCVYNPLTKRCKKKPKRKITLVEARKIGKKKMINKHNKTFGKNRQELLKSPAFIRIKEAYEKDWQRMNSSASKQIYDDSKGPEIQRETKTKKSKLQLAREKARKKIKDRTAKNFSKSFKRIKKAFKEDWEKMKENFDDDQIIDMIRQQQGLSATSAQTVSHTETKIPVVSQKHQKFQPFIQGATKVFKQKAPKLLVDNQQAHKSPGIPPSPSRPGQATLNLAAMGYGENKIRPTKTSSSTSLEHGHSKTQSLLDALPAGRPSPSRPGQATFNLAAMGYGENKIRPTKTSSSTSLEHGHSKTQSLLDALPAGRPSPSRTGQATRPSKKKKATKHDISVKIDDHILYLLEQDSNVDDAGISPDAQKEMEELQARILREYQDQDSKEDIPEEEAKVSNTTAAVGPVQLLKINKKGGAKKKRKRHKKKKRN